MGLSLFDHGLWHCATARPHRFGVVVAAGVLGALALVPRVAEACRSNDHPIYTITELAPPASPSGVARDAGIIVSATASPASGGPSTFAEVALIDVETGAPVPLLPVAWYAFDSARPTMAFRPAEALAARRQYSIEAIPFDEVNGGFGAPVSSSFTTSDAFLDPITLSGEFVFTLRPREVDLVEIVDRDSCGGGRERVVGKRRQLYVDVQLPVPSGGQGTYHAVMHLTDDTPVRTNIDDAPEPEGWQEESGHRVQSQYYAHVESDEALTLSQPFFEQEFAYAGCFNFAVWDPAGNLAQASACLPLLTPEEIIALTHGDAPTELAADEGIAVAQLAAAVERANRPDRNVPVWSCALGTDAPRSMPAWLAMMTALLLGRRLSRAPRRAMAE